LLSPDSPRARDPELEIVLACVRAASVDVRLIAPTIDWSKVLQLAARHDVLPIVHLHLSRCSFVPESVRVRLSQAADRHTRNSLLLGARLLAVMSTLEEHGIAAIPFKGPTLAESAYGNMAYRQCEDLDLFIAPSDVSACRGILEQQGYRGPFPVSPGQRKMLLWSANQIELRSPDNVWVELHWSAAPRAFGIDISVDDLKRRCRRFQFRNHSQRALSAEDLLLVLCVHGAKHQWCKIKWICDVAAIIRSEPAIDWDTLRSVARRTGTERMIRLGLHLAQTVLAATIPAAVDRWVNKDGPVASLAEGIRQGHSGRPGETTGTWGLARFQIAVRARRRDKLRYVWRSAMTPTPTVVNSVPLPSFLTGLYAVLHISRLPVRLVAHALTPLTAR
jgi:hypothetical protein